MSLYRSRFSRFPRPVTMDDARAGLTRQLGYLGQPPNTRDVMNSYPMPIYPSKQFMSGWANYSQNPELYQQSPGPFIGRDLPPHLYPPRNWENIDLMNYIAFPGLGVEVPILVYQVPMGRNGVINKVATSFVGGGWTAGTGDIIWRILVDGATPPGATSYHQITDSLGSPAQPVGISGFRIFENQILTVSVLNNPSGANGGVITSGQRTGARLLGHLYPRDMEYLDLFV